MKHAFCTLSATFCSFLTDTTRPFIPWRSAPLWPPAPPSSPASGCCPAGSSLRRSPTPTTWSSKMRASPSARSSGWVRRKRDAPTPTAPCWSRTSCRCQPSSCRISVSPSSWGSAWHRATGRKARRGLTKLVRERSSAWWRSWCLPSRCAGFLSMCSTCCGT